jgi:hypothetical protein
MGAAGALVAVALIVVGAKIFLGDRGLREVADQSVGGVEKSGSAQTGLTVGAKESRDTGKDSYSRALVEQTVKNFVQSLTLGDFNDVDQAYSFLSKEKQRDRSKESFRDDFFISPRIWKVVQSVPSKTPQGQVFVQTELDVIDEYLGTYDRRKVTFDLVKENGSWKIQKYDRSSQTH